MIRFKTGNILAENVEALVNTVNCVGVMGRGISLQFKKAFPDNFESYAATQKKGGVEPGQMFIFETGQLANPRTIINFPTKRHWRGKSRMEDIESGLVNLVEEIQARNIRSIAIPPLGCGLGGLDWQEVKPRIVRALEKIDNLDVVVFQPNDEMTDKRVNRSSDVPKMTTARAAVVMLMHRYLGGFMDPFITLLEVHKLMYFMQEAGEPLRLKFKKGHYGPYAENLRHLLNTIKGHWVSGDFDGGDKPGEELTLVAGAFEDADAFLKNHSETRERFKKVSDLVEGFESPFGLELLSTIFWIVNQEKICTQKEVIKKAYIWKKERFSEHQMNAAIDALVREQWISGFI